MARTKREITELARQARRGGYFAIGSAGLEGYVSCPECGLRVEGYRQIDLATGKRWTMARALDTAMGAHLAYPCEDSWR